LVLKGLGLSRVASEGGEQARELTPLLGKVLGEMEEEKGKQPDAPMEFSKRI